MSTGTGIAVAGTWASISMFGLNNGLSVGQIGLLISCAVLVTVYCTVYDVLSK